MAHADELVDDAREWLDEYQSPATQRVNQAQLGKELGISHQQAGRVVERLVEAGDLELYYDGRRKVYQICVGGGGE